MLFIFLCFLPLSVRSSDSTAVSRPEIIHTKWYSSVEHIDRRVDIYLPAAYDTCSRPLPVVMLIHGINGYEGAWQDKGHAVDSLEAMIAAGRCEPVILVMPDCNKWPYQERPITHGNLWKCLTHYGKLCREHELEQAVSDLIDMIDSTYAVSTYAIAGLSDGGRVAANVANRRPERVRQVGLFSPVLRREQVPRDSTIQYTIISSQVDIFFASGERFQRRLKRAHCPHQLIALEGGGHNWRTWRRCFPIFMETKDLPQ